MTANRYICLKTRPDFAILQCLCGQLTVLYAVYSVLYVQRLQRTQHYTVLRLVGYAHLHLSLTAHILCNAVQHGSAAG